MRSKETLLYRYQYVRNLILIPILFAFVVTSCGDSPVTPSEQIEDAKGTIQGVIVDKATGDALSGIGVTLVYKDSTDEGSQTFTGTTSSDGSFTLKDVPVSADAKTNDGDKSNPYTLRLDASSLENYRDSYLAEVDVVFESTEGGDGGIATDMVSNIRIPLSEQAVTVTGKAHTNTGKVISGVTVELYQYFNPVVNGNSSNTTEMLVASAETESDGSFTFEGVEEDASIYFKFIDKSDPSNVIDHETSTYTTPSGSENNASMDLGVVRASEEDRSGAFYITNITPEPGSDVGTDTSFTFTFNRPVADNAWTDASQGFGAGTFKDAIYFEDDGMKKSPGSVEFDVSWNEERTELTVTPENLGDAHEYRLVTQAAFDNDINGRDMGNSSPIYNGPVAYEDGSFVDKYDNELTFGASEFDYNEAYYLEFSTGDNTTAPHTPKVAVDSTTLNTDWDIGSHNLTWDLKENPAPVKEYELFISKNGGSYKHLATVPSDDAEFGELDYNLIGDDNYEYSNSTQAQRIIVDNSSPLDEANSYKVKVRAISTNLKEGEFSDPITFEDVISPGIESYTETDNANIYVSVEEPLDKGTVENTEHFTVTDDTNGELSISSVSYDRGDQDNPNGNSGFDIVITVDNASNLTNGDIEISSNVTDLTGNEFMTSDNSTTY